MAENEAFGRRIRLTIYAVEVSQQKSSLRGKSFKEKLELQKSNFLVTTYKPREDVYVLESNLMQGKRGFKISGTVNQYFALQPADATIEIYNLSPVECANILALRMKKVGNNKYAEMPLRIRVEAGYNNGYFGTIFDGQILKPTMVRPDANNTILRLTCLASYKFMSEGSILTQTFNDGVNFYSVAKQIAIENGLGDQINISDTLKKYLVDGAFVTSDTAGETMKNIANETGAFVSYQDNKLTIQTWNEVYSKPQDAIVLNSETGLMGFPALNSDGITFQSVLNPNIKVYSVVKIDNTVISNEQSEFLQNREVGAWLSSDGLYGVIKVSHQFDTTNGTFSTSGVALARDYYKYIGENQ